MSRIVANVGKPSPVPEDETLLGRTFELLGGSRLLKRRPSTRAEIHEILVRGVVTNAALMHLTQNLHEVPEEAIASVVGISTRTLRRTKEAPKKPLAPDLASKTWLLAETLAKAAQVFGGKEAAEHWMSEEVMGLDGARPIELLQTMQGAELVSDFLGQLEHGVYV